jgi:hypothetical protein
MTQSDDKISKIKILDIVNGHSPTKYGCTCKYMSEYLMQIIDKIKMDDEIFDSMVNTLCELRKSDNRYETEMYNCVNLQHNIQLLQHIIKTQLFVPSEKSINLLVLNCVNDVIMSLVEIKHKFAPNHFYNLVSMIETSIINNNSGNNLRKLKCITLSKIFEHLLVANDENIDTLNKIIKLKYITKDHVTNFLLRNKNIIITEEIFINACQTCNIYVCNALFDHGIPINDNTFTAACSIGVAVYSSHTRNSEISTDHDNKHELIIKFLDSKCFPLKKHFDAIVKKNVNFNQLYINIFVKSLIDYGYVVTYDDILSTIEYKIILACIDISTIEFDDKFTDACCEYNCHPYPNKETYTDAHLLSECKRSGNLSRIKQMLEKGAKPTSKCLNNACIRDNIHVIRLLISHGAEPDFECITKMVLHMKGIYAGSAISILVNKYEQLNEINHRKEKINIFPNLPIITDTNKIKCSTNFKNFFDEANKNKSFIEKEYKLKEELSYEQIKKIVLCYLKYNDFSDDNTYVIVKELISKYFNIPKKTIIQYHEIDKLLVHMITYKPDKQKVIDDKAVIVKPKKTTKKEKIIDDNDEAVIVKPKKATKKEKVIDDDNDKAVNVKPKNTTKKEKVIDDDNDKAINVKLKKKK